MKLASFILRQHAAYGVVEGKPVYDIGASLGSRFPDLKAVLAEPEGGAPVRAAQANAVVGIACEDVQWPPAIPDPGSIWCVGLDCRDHVDAMRACEPRRPLVLEKPVIFGRVAASQAGHLQPPS